MASPALGAGEPPSREPRFGGPDAVDNQLRTDAEERSSTFELGVLDDYRAWKRQLREDTGLQFAADYTSLGLAAAGGEGRDRAASGMVRLFGAFELLDRDGSHPGAFIWKLEHRHRYSHIPPSEYGFQAGYVGITSPPFSDQGFRVTNLYWRQRFADGRFALLLGFLDATDYLDVYSLASPWTGFANLVFSTGSASIALPNDALLGIAAGGMLTEHLYLIGGVGDANGNPENPFKGFETLFDDHELFSHVELGWTSAQDHIALDNVHLSFWHVDDRSRAGTPDGLGVNVSASWLLRERWLPFLRAGWARDGGSLLEATVSAGFGYHTFGGRDQLGVAANWGRPNADTFGPALDDQWSLEVFYRWQLLDMLAVTPDLQVWIDPAQSPDDGATWVFSLRLRFAL